MDRRALLKGLFGVAGAGALAVVLPPEAQALPGLPPDDPATGSNVLPNLEDLNEAPEDGSPELGEGVELAWHRRRWRRRRRRRRWRYRRYCRRYWWGGHWRRRCRRRRTGFWFWIWI